MILNIKIYFLIIWLINVTNGQDTKYYIGAVVDFATKIDKSLTPRKSMLENANEYESYITEAASAKADIIVFPECGLTSVHLPSTESELLSYAIEIPDPTKETINPCNSKNEWPPYFRVISCAAQKYKMYVVVNLPEAYPIKTDQPNKNVIYNTNVVFDRTGTLIARYRKFNLFVEPGFNSTASPELITFKTDFGVTFGTFICFDILFPSPSLELLNKYEDVTDIVYPTAWFSELPFLTAVQTQAGWAKANGVNLLAAGYNNPQGGSGGSGIYTADGNITYIMPSTHKSTLITYKIPIIKKRKISNVSQHKPEPINPTLEGMSTLKEDIKNYTTLLVNKSLSDYKLCHDEFCCVFDISFNEINNADYKYRLVVYDGVRKFGIIKNNIQICGIMACMDETIKSCGKRITEPKNPIVFDAIKIIGDMFIKNSSFIPSYTDYYLGSTNNYFYNVSVVDKLLKIEMKNLEPVKDLLGFGIYGTTFNFSSSTNNSCILLVSPILILITTIFYFIFY